MRNFVVILLIICMVVPMSAHATEPAATEPVAALAESYDLSGGYYFICDCDLGYDLKFYVPVEWAFDAFALNASGVLVNMSTSTCYAYCPEFPEYSVSCSRFSTFTYRSNNIYTDLNISDISDTNINFLDNEVKKPSDSDMLLVIAGLIFVFGACFMILRRR